MDLIVYLSISFLKKSKKVPQYSFVYFYWQHQFRVGVDIFCLMKSCFCELKGDDYGEILIIIPS